MRRNPRAARTLGLWTATWLFGLLLAGLLWVGDLSVQWPALLVPVLWALVALRTRRRDHDDGWRPIPPDRPGGRPPVLGVRTDTVERPALRRRERDDDWR
ncbi:MAG: uncharacterized protein JWQ45_1103 [Blastococcus sp.]|jgi:hypothetical protein|nr:uncharacterized protein [Blastococcus sp.]